MADSIIDSGVRVLAKWFGEPFTTEQSRFYHSVVGEILLVQIKPTDRMLSAGREIAIYQLDFEGPEPDQLEALREIYKAMIEAMWEDFSR